MSIPLLAVGCRSINPYMFKRLLLLVWSVEELCYLFKNNPFILDNSILDRKLVSWLEEECDLADLAKYLNRLLKQNAPAEEFVMAIVEYTGYLNPAEAEGIREVFRGNIGISDFEKELNNADFLLKSGKYQRSRYEYERILFNIGHGERVISGRVYHNRGLALARMFLFEEAAASFLKAYELGESVESGRSYLLCVRLIMDEMEYVRFVSEHPGFADFSLEVEHVYNRVVGDYNGGEVKSRLDELILDKEVGRGNDYLRGVEGIMQGVKRGYRGWVES